MDVTSDKLSANKTSLASRWRAFSSGVPLIGWLIGALVAVLLEQMIGTPLAQGMWLPKVPVLFGCVIVLKKPLLIPSAMAYMLLIYVLCSCHEPAGSQTFRYQNNSFGPGSHPAALRDYTYLVRDE